MGEVITLLCDSILSEGAGGGGFGLYLVGGAGGGLLAFNCKALLMSLTFVSSRITSQ